MENQYSKILGYRELNEDKIKLINEIKELLEQFISLMHTRTNIDQRWVDIGKTHLQQGLMALIRAVAKPSFF